MPGKASEQKGIRRMKKVEKVKTIKKLGKVDHAGIPPPIRRFGCNYYRKGLILKLSAVQKLTVLRSIQHLAGAN